MEINKTNFEQIKNSNINSNFETLDVNGDGIINGNDALLSQDSEICEQINLILNSTDPQESVQIVEDTGETKNIVLNLSSANFNEEVTNSEGTTFLVINDPANLSCCSNTRGMIWADKMAAKYGDRANIVYASLSSPSYVNGAKGYNGVFSEVDSDTKTEIQNLLSQMNYEGAYPCVIRLVDGVPKEATYIKNYDDKTINSMEEKIEGTKTVSSNRSKEEFKESVKRGCGMTTYMTTEQEASKTNGITFVLYNCVTVSTSKCGDAAANCENLQNNMSDIYDVMYELKDDANFIYQPCLTYYGPLGEDGKRLAKNAPCIVIYENGVQKEVIWLDDSSKTSADGLKDIFSSKLGINSSLQNNLQENLSTNNDDTASDTQQSTRSADTSLTETNKVSEQNIFLENYYKDMQSKFEEKMTEYQKILDQISNTKASDDKSELEKKAENLKKDLDSLSSKINAILTLIT